MKWPPIYKAMDSARRPCKKGRQKWEYKCAICSKWWPRKEVCADHRNPCGALRDFSDAGGFLERLLVEKEGIDVLCKGCHAAKTKREREDGKSKVG